MPLLEGMQRTAPGRQRGFAAAEEKPRSRRDRELRYCHDMSLSPQPRVVR